MEQDNKQSQPHRSIRKPILCRRFEIKEKVFMISPQDDEKPKTFNYTLSNPKVKKWIKAIEKEIESMKTN